MTDDISKVEIPRYVLRIEGGATGWGCYPHKADDGEWCKYSEVLRSKFYADLVSATTPAEVDAPGIDTANHAGVRVRGYTVEQYATLARQLAEAKAEIAAHERNDLAETDLIHSFLQRLEQAESALAAATRRVAEVEGWISVEDRLPEDGAVTYCYEPRKGNQFVSQFHAEMPGGKPGWTEEFYERAPSIDGCAGGWGHWPFVTHWRPAFESPAKLPKEPK